jgi:hypothetical protein
MSFISLFIGGIAVYIILRLFRGLIDNRVKIDPEKEQRLTEEV